MKTAVRSNIELSREEERIVFTMQLLGDKNRYRIFKLLLADEQLCVSEIASKLDITTSAVSQHFRSFELIGLVDKQRLGQRICYSLKTEDPIVKPLIGIVVTNNKGRI